MQEGSEQLPKGPEAMSGIGLRLCPTTGMPEEEKGCQFPAEWFQTPIYGQCPGAVVCDSINAACFISWAIQANHHYLTPNYTPNFV